MRVCSTCYGAGEDFRKALLAGSEEGAMAAYSTGCVNLRVPYTIYHNEVGIHLISVLTLWPLLVFSGYIYCSSSGGFVRRRSAP